MKLSERFGEALVFATELHATQKRKDTEIPYVSHLLAVAGLVLEHGGGEDEAIAALLHDALEDQATNYPGGDPALRAAIRDRFGEAVLAIVQGCTDGEAGLKRDAASWRGRKENYLAALAAKPGPVRLVSCADKLHNVRAILADYRAHGEALWMRFNGGRDGTLWYYSELARVFAESGPTVLARELGLTVTALQDLCLVPVAGERN